MSIRSTQNHTYRCSIKLEIKVHECTISNYFIVIEYKYFENQRNKPIFKQYAIHLSHMSVYASLCRTCRDADGRA